jgi:4-amino-4-deoxy-L-arabinose transferase-like glycosyltransferase
MSLMAKPSLWRAGGAMAKAPSERRGLSWRALALLALLSLVFFLPGLTSLPPVDRDESRYAVASTQMLTSHDFIDVRFQDRPRYLQPAGIYWLQALSVAALSSPASHQIWAHRVPSVIMATAAILLTAWIGDLMFGTTAGIAAALLMMMCVLLNFEARMAKIDATLLAVTLLAQAALLRAYLGQIQRTRWNAILFWAALGAGLMLKGPIILIVSGGTTLGLIAQTRRIDWLKRLHAGWGVLLTMAIALPWLIAIGVVSHGLFFEKAIGQNLLGKVGHSEQSHSAFPGYYLAMFNLTFWPGSLAAIFAIPWTWRHRKMDQVRFLLAWIVPTWLIYEMISTKLPHYALPFYPAIACLAAAAATTRDGWRTGRWGRALGLAYAGLWLATGVAGAAFGVWLNWRYQGRIDGVAVAAGVVAVACMLLALWFLTRRDRGYALAAAGAASLVLSASLMAHTLPAATTVWLSPRIAALLNEVKPCPDSPLASSAFSEPSLVFLTGRPTRYINVKDTADYLSKHRACAMALVGARQLQAFQAEAAHDGLTTQPIGEVKGLNYSAGKMLDMTLFKAAN